MQLTDSICFANSGKKGIFSFCDCGERKSANIVAATITAFEAKIVIMDEPTAALAVKEVGKVLDLIKGLKNLGEFLLKKKLSTNLISTKKN